MRSNVVWRRAAPAASPWRGGSCESLGLVLRAATPCGAEAANRRPGSRVSPPGPSNRRRTTTPRPARPALTRSGAGPHPALAGARRRAHRAASEPRPRPLIARDAPARTRRDVLRRRTRRRGRAAPRRAAGGRRTARSRSSAAARAPAARRPRAAARGGRSLPRSSQSRTNTAIEEEQDLHCRSQVEGARCSSTSSTKREPT